MLCNREEPSWEPSPGLEKSTLQLLGCSTGQGGHPFPQQLPGKKKKREEKPISARPWWWKCHFYCLSFLFLPFSFFFFFFGDVLSLSLRSVPQPWPKPWRAGEVLLLCLGMFLISSVSLGWRDGGREGFLGQALCNSICRAGGNLGLSSACSAFNSHLFGAKNRVFNSPSPAQLIFEVIFERFGAPRRNPRSRFFKTWHHAHPNHWHK